MTISVTNVLSNNGWCGSYSYWRSNWFLVKVWFGWDLLMKIWLSRDFLVKIGLSGNFLMNVGFGGNFLMNVRLGGNFFVEVGFSRNFFVIVRLSGDFLMEIRFRGWVYFTSIIIWVYMTSFNESCAISNSGVTYGSWSNSWDWCNSCWCSTKAIPSISVAKPSAALRPRAPYA